ncbi:MAG: immunoglobulin domain-containing protein, partial [Candidatus Hydrogenedens sp.]|nr:immunoglobulin domain-containing protein [Candidatus Hydrogenedens sp.]
VQIEVQNVKDIYGNLIDPDWDTVVCSSIGIPPYVIDVRVVDSKRIRVLFSEAMEPYMILATRYSLSGPGKGTLSTNPNTVQKIAPDNYLLNWNNGNLLQGEDITVSVSTGTDLAGNYLIEPKSKTVTNRIKILSYLVGGDYYLGDAVVLSFNISGGEGALTYQWLKDGESVGPNSNTWEINGLTLQDAGEYQCYVGDSREEMVYTNKVRLRIYPRMELLQQPEGAIVVDGGHYTLMINITGGIPPINYQWWKDGEPIGGNESMLLIEDMSKEDEGIYWVEVSDAKETIVSKQVEIKYTTGLTSITSFGIVNIIIVIVVMGVLYVRKLNIAQR